MNRPRKPVLSSGIYLLTIGAVLAGCGNNSSGPDGGTDGGVVGPYYAIASTLMANTMQATSVIFTTPSLASGAAVSEANAIPVDDVVSLFGVEGSGQAFSTAAMTPTVTRYDIDIHGTITPGPTISFAQFGLGTGFSTRSIVIISSTKGYLLDDTTLQAITFNPSTMTTGKAINLSAMQVAGYGASFNYTVPVRGGNQIVLAAYYYDPTFSKTISKTAVALIDTDNDTANIITDSRCGDFSSAAAAPNGDLYFASDTYASAINRVGGTAFAPAGCLLRMNAGENVFDPNYFVSTKDITGTLAGGGVVPGEGNSIWVRGFDESLSPVTATTTALSILGAPAWRWWKVDLAHPMGPGVESSFPPSAGELKYYTVGGNAVVDNGSADFSTTTEVNMSAAAMPVAGAVIKGQTSGIVKVR